MPSRRIPGYRFHKASGRAIIKFGGKVHYLGKWNSAESKAEYACLLAQWSANDPLPLPAIGELTIADLVAWYLDYADGYYRPGPGRENRQADRLKTFLEIRAAG